MHAIDNVLFAFCFESRQYNTDLIAYVSFDCSSLSTTNLYFPWKKVIKKEVLAKISINLDHVIFIIGEQK